MSFKVTDRAKLNDPRNIYDNNPGTVIAVDGKPEAPYQFLLDDDKMSGFAFWYPASMLTTESEQPVEFTPTPAVESPNDFSHSGLGIGGLRNYVETPTVPTVAQIERVEQMEASATYCRKCGQSGAFDGAMFTTGGGSICDDCF